MRTSAGKACARSSLVLEVGLEPTSLAAGDFETPVYTIPPLQPVHIVHNVCVARKA